ncbi:CbtA family protein [Sodalis sp. dw_96]|uniref:CbtA family protein n=1 Tax=Sodalis sp. dw_96 TaxID=2719794 RepID=UPI001BD639C1|nr:CbtA family protein [Sodalis sp. dw_96]
MVGNMLMRGMLIGLVAALLAFGFARVFGEPQVNRAIAFEEKMNAAKGEAPEPVLVSRGVQSSVGLLTGIIGYGVGIGGLFSLVFAYCYGRAGRISPRMLAVLIAAAGFLSIIIVPELKYPANPPSVGNPDTIGYRTELYFFMIVLSIAGLVLAIKLGRGLAARHGAWSASLLAGLFYIVVMGIVQSVLPAINEVPADFPAVVLWQFRVASLGIQLILWCVLGLAFGIMTERSLEPRPKKSHSHSFNG